jgi:tRNA-splicing ligase RtcB
MKAVKLALPVVEFSPGGRVPVKRWDEKLESAAKKQLSNLATLPFMHSHVASMADAHHGLGSPVGTVIATKRAIIPAAVGVDIGCGMMALRLGLKAEELPENLAHMRTALEGAIPHGRTDDGGVNDRGAWGVPPEEVTASWSTFLQRPDYMKVKALYPGAFSIGKGGGAELIARGERQLGTLGSGNHFVELCVDDDKHVWLMLHSGSRGVGNRIGTFFIEKAKEMMERWHIGVGDPDLAYLAEGEPIFQCYWDAINWAQDYARMNRELMARAGLRALSREMGRELVPVMQAVNCHHNYATKEFHYGEHVYITRKGAISAKPGELGIIPGSMGASSYIVSGRGDPESFDSAPHGAGRRMARNEAKRRFTVADLESQTSGVECRKDIDVLDEIPGAYKDINGVIDASSTQVSVVARLRQVVCVKG